MSVSVIILFAVAFGYLAAALYMGWGQERRVFQPKPGLAATPRDIDLPFTEVILTTSDGVRLHAWRLEAASWSENPLWILHLHGQGTNLGDQLSDLRFWHDLGFAILALDYRGYGLQRRHAERGRSLPGCAHGLAIPGGRPEGPAAADRGGRREPRRERGDRAGRPGWSRWRWSSRAASRA